MAGIGGTITGLAMKTVTATFDTQNALGELSSLGVKDLKAVEDAAMKEKTMTKVPVVVQTVVEAEKLRIRQHDNFNIRSNERNCN